MVPDLLCWETKSFQGRQKCCSAIPGQPQACGIPEEASGREVSNCSCITCALPLCSVEYFKKTTLINALNSCWNSCSAICQRWFMDNHQFILLITLTSSMYCSEQRMTIYLTAFGRKICCVPQLYKEH